jgi:peptidoglycan/LPS O-acetylase OafA/YrhL
MTASRFSMERLPKTTDRVSGLDSIRFICALFVFFGHGAGPAIPNPFPDGSFIHLAFRGFLGSIWSGPAAVIVFFVISGFCIHYPFAAPDKRPRLKEFYARRFLRLLVPVVVAVPLSAHVGVHLTLFQDSILWSLVAELIYYLCYPLLRVAQLRLGSWRGIILVSFAGAFAVAASNPSAGDYPSYGPSLNWLLGLPCWLLGCMIAESARTAIPPHVSTIKIWAWRMGIFSLACFCTALRFKTPIGYPWTLNFFAVAAALWLQREIGFRQRVAPFAFLEWAGLWSYSLYLFHVPAVAFFSKHFPSARGTAPGWVFMVLFVFAICYAFYLIIERPSHLIARRAAHKLRSTTGTSLATNAA